MEDNLNSEQKKFMEKMFERELSGSSVSGRTSEPRPHGLIGNLTPQEFTEQAVQTGLQEARNFQHGVV